MFVIGARALTSGRYCVLTSPGCPALTSIDPGWAWMLAPLAALTENPAPFQVLSALLLALAPAGVWLWLRRRADGRVALLAAALFASCPLVLEQSGVVMSEVPFVLLLLGALAASESGLPAAAGGLNALLLLTRTAGLAALPGLLLPFARKPRRAALAAVPPALAAAGWWAWCLSKRGTVGKFDLLPSTYAGRAVLKPFAVALANLPFYLKTAGGCFLPPGLAGGALAALLGAALAAAALRGLVLVLRRRRDDPAAWALAGSALLLSVWGWQYERYLLPLLPLLLWALAEGLGRAAKPALAVLLLLQLGLQTLPRLFRPSPWAEPELSRTYDWLKTRPRPALLASAEPVRDGWWSDLPAVSLPPARDAAALAAALKARRVSLVLRVDGQDYGLEADPGAALRRRVEDAYAALDDARLFRKVHEEPGERATVYEAR